MKKCKLTVEKAYENSNSELKTSYSIEFDERSLAALCSRVANMLHECEDSDLRHLYDMLAAF